jgi:2-polyprenyl-3-methyl-5-hydroxy-6-metoxy-1,4-benzoquinol methylase
MTITVRFLMAEAAQRDHWRERFYTVYATTHTGAADLGSAAVAFRRDILSHLPRDRDGDILDVGCGQGQLVKQLLRFGFSHARGIDASPEQVEMAHGAGITQVSLGDYREDLKKNALDVVIATDFFEHLTKFEIVEALDSIRDALRPGGILLTRVPNAVSPFAGNYLYGDMTHETALTPRSIRQLAAVTGFANVEIYPCNVPAHGSRSALRALLWRGVAGVMKAALIVETGQLRGHMVTQNIVAVLGGDADHTRFHGA